MIKLIIILLLTFSILFIAGCGSTDNNRNVPAPSGGGCGVISKNIGNVNAGDNIISLIKEYAN